MLHNATRTAVIDNINERINMACNTHNELRGHNLYIAATTTMLAPVLVFEGYAL